MKDDDLVVGTNGRSLWILDDLTPLRDCVGRAGKPVHLFPPGRPSATATRRSFEEELRPRRRREPADGAILHYYSARPSRRAS